jgi:hypothetical protein
MKFGSFNFESLFYKIKIFIFIYIINIFINIDSSIKNNIYVTLTSWKGRIKFIGKNIETIINNTIKPKKVILNLSIDEFPKKTFELPKDILNLMLKYDNFEIFWVKEDNNVFKKLIPTLDRYKSSLIISVDDDISYPKNTIEEMLKCYNKYGGRNPVSFGGKVSDWNIDGTILHSHFGPGTIVKYKYFGEKLKEIYMNTTVNRIKKGIKCPSDVLYTYAALLNGYYYIRCRDFSISKYRTKTRKKYPKPFSENSNKHFLTLLNSYHNVIRNYLKEKYNFTLKEIINNYHSKKK